MATDVTDRDLVVGVVRGVVMCAVITGTVFIDVTNRREVARGVDGGDTRGVANDVDNELAIGWVSGETTGFSEMGVGVL